MTASVVAGLATGAVTSPMARGTRDHARIGWRPVSSDARVASARIRCLNPLGLLREWGEPVELFQARRADAYDVVVYSKRYDDAARREAAALRARGTRVVLDLCDNHFYVPPGRRELAASAAALRAMVDVADAVVASTETLADVVRSEVPTSPPITVIGDAVEVGLRRPAGFGVSRAWHDAQLAVLRARLRRGGAPRGGRIVWFGVAGGPRGEYGMRDLLARRGAIESVARDSALSLTIISNSRAMYREHLRGWRIPTFYLPWTADTVELAMREHDVAVIPVAPTPFTLCKTNNRVVAALSAGLAVVADEIPSYRPFADVCRLDDWEAGLRTYVTSPAVRLADVAAGRALIDREWSLPAVARRWRDFFVRLLGA